MIGKRLFLQWSLFVCLLAIGAVIGAKIGLMGVVFGHDPTRMIALNVCLFLFVTAWCGRLSWRLDGGEDHRVIEDALANGWFTAEACVTLGLLGTVIGYIVMVQNPGADNAAGQLAEQIRTTLGPALISTAVGGYCGFLLQVQSHFIGQAIKKVARQADQPRKEGGP